ncbi:DUF411 domain-containing protein [Leucothrix pacifica]|uniref:Metal-binding protein n=1 Tax=Leucothrix pacifica TaxID=1247513 RepID=A0A317C0X2_9GAMM|nr:DUF411 domain-containing protein [Leucothrix pacifica]PWQ92294.1 metal-binding protein [Leucothrix pacifica]
MKNTIYSSRISIFLLTVFISSTALLTQVYADEVIAPNATSNELTDTPEATKVAEESTTEQPKTLPLPLVTVYKSASCGCCAAWIDHMKDNGFPVEAHDSDNLNQYKIKAKLGPGLGSCHTAFVGDYAIEGHVPADDVKRLLSEKPDISGLTAPGMPMNSPGMAPKGSKPSGYDVISFKDGEAVGVFTEY